MAIEDAGDFLAHTSDAVRALADMRLTDPTGPAVAAAYAKCALSGRGVAIALHDTLRREIDRVVALEPLTTSQFNGVDVAVRREVILAGVTTLTALVASAAYWGDSSTDAWWLADIERLASQPAENGELYLLNLRLAPSVLLWHAAGIAATAAGRLVWSPA